MLCIQLEALVETRDPAAVLCYTCDRLQNNIHTLEARAETIKVDVREKASPLHMVEVCRVKKLGRFLNIEPPPNKKARVESVEDVADIPSFSSELESNVPTTSQESLSADSCSCFAPFR